MEELCGISKCNRKGKMCCECNELFLFCLHHLSEHELRYPDHKAILLETIKARFMVSVYSELERLCKIEVKIIENCSYMMSSIKKLTNSLIHEISLRRSNIYNIIQSKRFSNEDYELIKDTAHINADEAHIEDFDEIIKNYLNILEGNRRIFPSSFVVNILGATSLDSIIDNAPAKNPKAKVEKKTVKIPEKCKKNLKELLKFKGLKDKFDILEENGVVFSMDFAEISKIFLSRDEKYVFYYNVRKKPDDMKVFGMIEKQDVFTSGKDPNKEWRIWIRRYPECSEFALS